VFHDSPKTTTGSSEDFDSQGAAEAWMGEHWRRLLDEGSLAATLYDGDDKLYTMKLTED